MVADVTFSSLKSLLLILHASPIDLYEVRTHSEQKSYSSHTQLIQDFLKKHEEREGI